MKITLPKRFLGKPVAGTLERVLAGAPTPPTTAPTNSPVATPPTPASINDPQSYIVLPGATHGSYRYGELLVAKHRLGKSTATDRAGQQLGMQFQDTAQEQDNTPYIGNMNWETALKLNLTLGNTTLTPRQFIDFLAHIKRGMDTTSPVYDGRGTAVTKPELTQIYNEITQKRDPYRAEWLDAKFGTVNSQLCIMYDHSVNNAKLVERIGEPLLAGYLEEDAYVDLASTNNQGIPTKKSRKQDFYYWQPRDGYVAGFSAYSDRAYLDCDGDPSGARAVLGVRAARKKI